MIHIKQSKSRRNHQEKARNNKPKQTKLCHPAERVQFEEANNQKAKASISTSRSSEPQATSFFHLCQCEQRKTAVQTASQIGEIISGQTTKHQTQYLWYSPAPNLRSCLSQSNHFISENKILYSRKVDFCLYMCPFFVYLKKICIYR